MNIYLVQRGKFSKRDWEEGIDGVLKFDYMGSAEFEFGALGKSLRNIRKNVNNYIFSDQVISAYGKKTKYRLFAPKNKVEIIEGIELIALNKVRLKEQTYFDVICGYDSFYKPRVNFWWDIENHYMWWLPNELETQLVESLRRQQ